MSNATTPAPAPCCHRCHGELDEATYLPRYAPFRADAGPLLCPPCNTAAWASIDAAAATQPATGPWCNVWD